MLPYEDHNVLYLQNKEFEENAKYSFSNDNFFLAKFFFDVSLDCIIVQPEREKKIKIRCNISQEFEAGKWCQY